MSLDGVLKRIKRHCGDDKFDSEAKVSQGIVTPILRALDWDDADVSEVIPKYSVKPLGEGNPRLVDRVLCAPASKAQVLIEVKSPVKEEGQLFEYAYHSGIQFVVLVEAVKWSFYLLGQEGEFKGRPVFKLDISHQDISSSADRLQRYLNYKTVHKGEHLDNAKEDLENERNREEAKKAIEQSWNKMVDEVQKRPKDSFLLDWLSENATEFSEGYYPENRDVQKFVLQTIGPQNPPPPPPPPKEFCFEYLGKTYTYRNGVALYVGLLRVLDKEDSELFNKLHNDPENFRKTRKRIAKSQQELYSGKIHDNKKVGDWYVDVNLSNLEKRQRMDWVIKVSGVRVTYKCGN